MMGHKICFNGEIKLIIPLLSRYPFLSGSLHTWHLKVLKSLVLSYLSLLTTKTNSVFVKAIEDNTTARVTDLSVV